MRNSTFVARVVALLDDVPEHGHAQILSAIRHAVARVVMRDRPGQRVAAAAAPAEPSTKFVDWSPGDVFWLARGHDFRRVELHDGHVIAGEAAWRDAVDTADASTLIELRERLRADPGDDDDDEPASELD